MTYNIRMDGSLNHVARATANRKILYLLEIKSETASLLSGIKV
jgi:hypothetical protein